MTECERVPLTGLRAGGDDVQVFKKEILLPSSGSMASGGGESTKSIGTGELVSGGSGGVLVYLANAYITDPKLNGLLVFLAPTVGIIMITIYNFIAAQAGQRWKSRREEQVRIEILKRAEYALETARGYLSTIEADDNATSEHKKKARDRVQAIELAVLELSVKGIVAIE